MQTNLLTSLFFKIKLEKILLYQSKGIQTKTGEKMFITQEVFI